MTEVIKTVKVVEIFRDLNFQTNLQKFVTQFKPKTLIISNGMNPSVAMITGTK